MVCPPKPYMCYDCYLSNNTDPLKCKNKDKDVLFSTERDTTTVCHTHQYKQCCDCVHCDKYSRICTSYNGINQPQWICCEHRTDQNLRKTKLHAELREKNIQQKHI